MSAVTINRCSYANKFCYMRETLTGTELRYVPKYPMVPKRKNPLVQTIRRKPTYVGILTDYTQNTSMRIVQADSAYKGRDSRTLMAT